MKYLCLDPSGTGTTGVFFFQVAGKSKHEFSEYKRTVGLYKLIGGIVALKYVFNFIQEVNSIAVNQVKPFKDKLFRGQEQIENLTCQAGRGKESKKSIKRKIKDLKSKKRLGIRQKEELERLENILAKRDFN
ncbi:16100_t:CDS:2 [Entrophospora sp. SA101]|nr:15569_t:CDS:2 [Entrophospora sp. SA101]CAJ0761141.1 16100_t:CDS:2 [Entrophospora sp. SA101]CAJ0824718.1 6761_t:CDS:2 [Entrophospora sp. SA101]CAJ0830599.1 5591_t:CDS:2 [Entrophospora sp. SA101]CAJ0912864.1 11092_t:CDS:2 [Entrophospora sp. SA101]